jgi:hypothetical protein
VSHPIVLALYPTVQAAAAGAEAIHGLGIDRQHISVVARSHEEARALANQLDATPGVELEDSPTAGRLGELAGALLAAIGQGLPGVGPIVAVGPLAAQVGELTGHAAGGLSTVLSRTGVPRERADVLQEAVSNGAVLLGVHLETEEIDRVREILAAAGATEVVTARWQ